MVIIFEKGCGFDMINKTEILNLFPHALFDEPMKIHTTFRIGGNADCFISAKSTKDIIDAIEYANKNNIPFMIMGNGSNMLVSDKGIRGIVLQISKDFSNCEIDGCKVTAEAGILLSSLASRLQKASLSGFEELSGIPGTLGGAIYMNAGAYGGEMKNIVKEVTFVTKDGQISTLPNYELDFGYRHSIFEDNGAIILSATLELEKGVPDEIKAKMSEFTKRRNEKQPINMPSAGSAFKRPEGYFAGKLIEDANLKGYAIGGAQISEKHSGFIVSTGNATAKDVVNLIEHVQKTVKEKFGVDLEPEIRLIGEK